MVHQPHAVAAYVADQRGPRARDDRSGRLRGDDGLSMVLVALMIIPLLIVTAFAVDMGAARSWRRQSQNSTDVGSLAGAILLPAGAGATARAEAAEVTARNMLANQTVSIPTPVAFNSCPAILGSIPAPDSSTTQCWTVVNGATTVYLAVANPYDNALIGSTVPDDRLVWVRACKVQRHAIGPAFGQKTLNMCTQSVARNSVAAPLPAIFAMKTTTCDNSKGVNAGGGLHVYEGDGTVGGLIQSNCPDGMGLTGTAQMDKDPKVIVNAVNGEGGPPSGGWGTITHSSTPPLADPYAYPGGSMAIPDFPSSGGDCFPDDPRPAFANCPSRTGPTVMTIGGLQYRVWFPGRYTGSVSLGEGQTNYFMPGIYDIRGSVGWNAKSTSRNYWLTNNGKAISHTDAGCGTSLDQNLFSCPLPVSGTPSSLNRGGGALWYISGDANMYGIGTFHMYPVQTGTYAGMSMMCNRTNGNLQEWQFDGPLEPPGDYDLNGIVYCATRNIEVSGNLTLKNGRLWAASIEYDGTANINVYTPTGETTNSGDLGLEW